MQNNLKISQDKGKPNNPFNITVLPGDGVGLEVIEQSLKILDLIQAITKVNFAITAIPCGGKYYSEHTMEWPEGSFEKCKCADAILLGAIGYLKNGKTVMTLPGKPYPDSKIAGYGPVIGNRQKLELYANVRPVKLFPGIKHKISGQLKAVWAPENVDFVIVRENTEDAYTGEYVQKPDQIDTPIRITRAATERIARFAFRLAQKRNKQSKVTCIDKSNVIKSHEFFRKVITEIWQNEFFHHIKLEYAHADLFSLSQMQEPERYDVVVAPNFVGDIVSDGASLLQGGLGMAPSGNIGENNAMFEPVHGSAPDIAGTGKANPIAAILSVKMMLEWLADRFNNKFLQVSANCLELAVIDTIKAGILTQDMTDKNKRDKAVSCDDVGNAIKVKMSYLLVEAMV